MEEKKEKWYKKVWNYLDGKKTAIGSGMLFLSGAFKPYTLAYQILYWGGGLLSGTGWAHKVQKGELKIKT